MVVEIFGFLILIGIAMLIVLAMMLIAYAIESFLYDYDQYKKKKEQFIKKYLGEI